MQISVGSFDFMDFKIDYNDGFAGIESQLHLGKLYLDAKDANLQTLRFDLDDFQLSDTKITYLQTKPFVSKDTAQSQLPYLAVDNLELSNVQGNYHSVPDTVSVNVDLGTFLLELPKANLPNNEFEIKSLSLDNSTVAVQLPKAETVQDSTIGTLKKSVFEWPKVMVKAANISLKNNIIDYVQGNSQSRYGEVSPNNIVLSNFNLQADKLEYRPEDFQFELEQISFHEKSGFRLRHLAFDARLDNTKASLSSVELRANSSSIHGDLSLQYSSMHDFIDSPQNTSVDLQLPQLNLALQDMFYFQPELAENEQLQKMAQRSFKGNLMAEGTLEKVRLSDLQIAWGDSTSLIAEGKLQHLTRMDSLSFDFDNIKAVTVREDVLKFVSEKDLGISIPQEIIVEAKAVGTSNDMDANVHLKIPEGTVQITGTYQNQEQIRFDGNLVVDSLQLNELLNNDQLGSISLTLDIVGGGGSLNSINAKFESDFSQLELKNYDFSNLEIQGQLTNGQGEIGLNFKDGKLNFKAKTTVDLDSVSSNINFDLNVIGADLYALGITQESIKVGLDASADFSGNPTKYKLAGTIENGIAVYDNEQYQLGPIVFGSEIDSVRTDVTIDSDFLKGGLKSNASPRGIDNALTEQFRNYFRNADEIVSASDSVRLELDLRLRPHPILTDVFFRGIEQLDSVTVQADFDASTKLLNAELHMPLAKYQGSTIDSLNVLVKGNATNLDFTAGLATLLADPINIKRTYFEGNLNNKELLLDFISFDGKDKVAHIASEMILKKDTTRLHINPDELIFNKKEWSIPPDNQISIAQDFMAFDNVRLSRNTQQLSISNAIAGVQKEHIGITFDNFRVQTFLSLLNPEEALASGLVEGSLIIENPFGATGIVADFKVNSLEVMENPLGNLSLDATSKGSSAYDFNMALKDGGADLDLKGDYTAAESGAKLNLDLNLNRIDLKTIQGFTNEAIKDSHGSISGKIDVSGTTAAPKYEGSISFNDADFNVSSLNSVFKISEETLEVDNEGLYLNDFQIVDANGSDLTLDGTIITSKILNPSFDLKLNTEKFNALNSTAADNELFYGIASLDADVTVKGDLELPIVEGKVRIRKITDVTYVVPESQLDVEERDGVVIFVNREDPDAILTRNDQEETPSLFQGMDVKALLEIAEDANFHIIIDERTGDNLKVAGDAALNLDIEPNGRIKLTGRYELKSGHYETSLYNLVNRRFEINPGSTITWQGDPMDAKLDVTAIYELETSAAPLMSSVTSGQDISVTGKYRQVLPFMVYLHVDGKLLEPKLSFELDMPEDEQGSLGGAVYGRVQQLNQQEAELNKQVFSLLALNRFYPDSGSDGSVGGTAAIARDNVNKVLSGELNAFSDKVFGKSGFEVDFDLDSFTDYQGETPQDRTQLNINAKKKLFNDRLIVTAGSAVDVEGSAQPGQEETPIIGNVSLEYLLTKDGIYRLRGFRKSEYENIIDGQLIVTGVALIFNREFNKFSQLFNPIKDDIKEKEEDDKKK